MDGGSGDGGGCEIRGEGVIETSDGENLKRGEGGCCCGIRSVVAKL